MIFDFFPPSFLCHPSPTPPVPPFPMSSHSRTSLVSHYHTGSKGLQKSHQTAKITLTINKNYKIFLLEPRTPGEHCRSIILKQVNWGTFSTCSLILQQIKKKCKETQPKLVLKAFVGSHWTTHRPSQKERNWPLALRMCSQETQQCTEL